MRHRNRGRKLNRTPSHRKAMVRNLVTSLFLHGRVITTPAKAKEARSFAEKLITLAKRGTLHCRRRAIGLLQDKSVVKSLFEEIGPRYAQRPGGYCRILHMDKRRIGDGAEQVIFELVEAEMPQRGGKSAPAQAATPPPETAPQAESPGGEDAAEPEKTEDEKAQEETPASEEKADEADRDGDEASVPTAEESDEADGDADDKADA